MTRLREILKDELQKYERKPITLPHDKKFLNYLLFEGTLNLKKFSEQLTEVLTKIDYSNVNFNTFAAKGFDFSSYVGIKLNPQTIYSRNLCLSVCADVEFIGSFENVKTEGTDFTGSNYELPVLEENEFREKIKTLIYGNYME